MNCSRVTGCLPDSRSGGGELGRRLARPCTSALRPASGRSGRSGHRPRRAVRQDLSSPLPRLVLALPECAEPVGETRHEVLPVTLGGNIARHLPRIETSAQWRSIPMQIPLGEAEFILSAANGIRDWICSTATAAILGGHRRRLAGAGTTAISRAIVRLVRPGPWVTARVYLPWASPAPCSIYRASPVATRSSPSIPKPGLRHGQARRSFVIGNGDAILPPWRGWSNNSGQGSCRMSPEQSCRRWTASRSCPWSPSAPTPPPGGPGGRNRMPAPSNWPAPGRHKLRVLHAGDPAEEALRGYLAWRAGPARTGTTARRRCPASARSIPCATSAPAWC